MPLHNREDLAYHRELLLKQIDHTRSMIATDPTHDWAAMLKRELEMLAKIDEALQGAQRVC